MAIGGTGTKWKFMEFAVETRGSRAAQNVLTEQSGLSRFAFSMADSPFGVFQVIFDNHMLKHIQQCTNVETRRGLGNEEREVSLCELNAFITLLHVRGAHRDKNFPFAISGTKNGAHYFFNKPCREIVDTRSHVFYVYTCAAQGQHARQTDKFSLISDICNRFVDNSISCFKPGENITIDEAVSDKISL